jgi:hypothetical protein
MQLKEHHIAVSITYKEKEHRQRAERKMMNDNNLIYFHPFVNDGFIMEIELQVIAISSYFLYI